MFSQGVDLFALRFYLDRVVPHQPFVASKKLETLGYPVRRLHPSAFPRFHTIPECDGQKDGRTDGQTDGFAIAYTAGCKASFAARCKKVTNIFMKKIKKNVLTVF